MSTPETISEQLDDLTAKLAQLSALLEHTYGGSSEAFNDMNDRLRGSYMLCCADLARECHQAIGNAHTQHNAERKAARKIGGAA
jgi:hypothetical protein